MDVGNRDVSADVQLVIEQLLKENSELRLQIAILSARIEGPSIQFPTTKQVKLPDDITPEARAAFENLIIE